MSERRAKKIRALSKGIYYARETDDEALLDRCVDVLSSIGATEAEIKRSVRSLVNSRRIHIQAQLRVIPHETVSVLDSESPVAAAPGDVGDSSGVHVPDEGLSSVRED